MKRTCTIHVPDGQRTLSLSKPQWTKQSNTQNMNHWSSKLVTVKKKLDVRPYNTYWSFFKAYINKYERVFMTSSHKTSHSVATYVPLSRSYFKLWELLHDFKLLETKKKIKKIINLILIMTTNQFSLQKVYH